jgi:hemerythrin-like domain-containing protein
METRRKFIGMVGGAAGALVIPAWSEQTQTRSTPSQARKSMEKAVGDEDVAPPEDLMREHGLLNRIMLIYEEIGRRVRAKQDFDPKALADSAGLIHTFIEDYHEKLEEEHLFPRFRKAGKLVDLVNTLQAQHQAGRVITQRLEKFGAAGLKSDADRNKAVNDIHAFLRMYRPHEAREDTVLFPEFRNIVTDSEFKALGDQFEKREHELFGEEGFEKNVDKVAGIEKQLGIYELAQFTPKT